MLLIVGTYEVKLKFSSKSGFLTKHFLKCKLGWWDAATQLHFQGAFSDASVARPCGSSRAAEQLAQTGSKQQQPREAPKLQPLTWH